MYILFLSVDGIQGAYDLQIFFFFFFDHVVSVCHNLDRMKFNFVLF